MSRRPRVGLIAYDYLPVLGGMGTYARALGRHLHRRGYDVHLFAGQHSQQDPPLPVHPILTADLAADIPRLARFDMDLWHAVNFGYAPVACMKRPFVLTVHGTDFLTPWVRFTMDRVPLLWRAAGWLDTRTARRAIYQPALRCVDQVLTCSRFSARLFRRRYPSVGRLQVVPNGVDAWFLETSRTNAGVARHPRRLLTVCKLGVANRRKNVDGCLRAMAMVADQLDLQYWIAGDGPQRPALEQLAGQLGITRRIRFLGRVSNEKLRDAYAASSLFVLVPKPRPADVEGFGIVYLEAAAAGTPSLASRCGGTTDAVADGQSGFFADDPSPAGIADALTRFFTGRIRFDEQTVRDHAARHTWPTVLEHVERIYESLLGRRPAPRATIQPDAAIQTNQPPALHVRSARDRDWAAWIERTPEIRAAAPAGGRALLVSYMFPPTGGSAVQRPAKLTKYLPQFGWSVEVLTAAHDRFPWFDESLLADVPADSRVHRVSGYEPACLAGRISSVFRGECGTAGTEARGGRSRGEGRHGSRPSPRQWFEDRLYWRMVHLTDRLGMGNGEAFWIDPAVGAALGRHRRCPFDVVISTGPPHFVHRVALRVARETGLPWVADVRDPFVTDYHRTPQSRRDADAMRRLERVIMRHAAIVVTTCSSLAEDLRSRYPRRSAGSICTVTNGFDRDDLRKAGPTRARDPGPREACVFVAAGSFYGRREIGRIVEPLQRVLDRHPEWRRRVRLVVAGTLDAEQRQRWERDRPEWLTLKGHVDHASAVRMTARAACAILVVPDCYHGRVSVPGKTYELLALPTHLLALVPPDGDAGRVAREAGASTVVRFEDCPQVASAIERIIADHFAGRLTTDRRWDRLDAYDRRSIAASFARCLSRADEEQRPITSPCTSHDTAPAAHRKEVIARG